jgi:hypothetical protein
MLTMLAAFEYLGGTLGTSADERAYLPALGRACPS